MSITGVVIRRRVADLDAALPFYEHLTGQTARRFTFSGAELASVGPFLLFTAPGEVGARLASVAATLVVGDLDDQAQTLVELGAQLVASPADTLNGRRLIARHPDGAGFEYVGRCPGRRSAADPVKIVGAEAVHVGRDAPRMFGLGDARSPGYDVVRRLQLN